jgi:hypothetical protein
VRLPELYTPPTWHYYGAAKELQMGMTLTHNKPAVVVLGYERPESLARLLASVAKADYRRCAQVTLVLSLDKSGTGAALETARTFDWPHGPKRLIERPSRLGFFDHVIACADLTAEYGSIILLEDDLYVTPDFYNYAAQALAFYADEPSVAGISLYGTRVNEYTPIHLPFQPLADGSPVFFLQKGLPWGWAVSQSQWGRFREWFADGYPEISVRDELPARVISWPASSLSKVFIKYLAESRRYVVYPRQSLSSNFGPSGAHRAAAGNHFQVPLDMSIRPRRFSRIEESAAVYDSHCELLPDRLDRLTDRFRGRRYAVDLYGTRDLEKVDADFVLTTRRTTRPLQSFARSLMPMEINIVEGIPGNDIVFCEKSAVDAAPASDATGTLRALEYFFADIPFGDRSIAELGALRQACLEKELVISDLHEQIARGAAPPDLWAAIKGLAVVAARGRGGATRRAIRQRPGRG